MLTRLFNVSILTAVLVVARLFFVEEAVLFSMVLSAATVGLGVLAFHGAFGQRVGQLRRLPRP